MKKKIIRNTGDGFTLVELITVLVILTVLTAMVVPSLIGFIDSAKEKRYVMEAQGVSRSVELYLIDHYDDDIDAMTLLAGLAAQELGSPKHMLAGYMVVTCTKNAYIENLTVDTEKCTVIELVYRVAGYRIVLHKGMVTVTRTRTGKGRRDGTGGGSVELDDGASSIY